MTEKQFGTQYGPPLKRNEKARCIVNLKAEIKRYGGVPYGWLIVYETLLFKIYNPLTGQCFPSHETIAAKAGCSVSTVQRALKWARQHNLIFWAHGLIREGWRVIRTSNRYVFAAFLSVRLKAAYIAASNGQKARRTRSISFNSLRKTDAQARSMRFPPAPCTFKT
jgi:DNA-binding GntR family transcriptional regulator